MCSERLPPDFPKELANLAFPSGNEVAWSPDHAVLAVEWFGQHRYAVLGTELWVVQTDGIQSLPLGRDGMRGVYGNTVNREKDEAWSSFVVRSTAEARAYLQAFDPSGIAEKGQPYFNVVWVSESGFNELELVKVVIELDEPDMGVTGERVWAAPLGGDLYEIRNSPWHCRQLNWGDVVRAKPQADDQCPVFMEVVRRSGHRTIHIYFSEVGPERRQEFLDKFNHLGASYENANSTMYALDFKSDVNIEPALSYLKQLREKGLLDYRISDSIKAES